MALSIIVNIIVGILAVVISFVSYYFHIKEVIEKSVVTSIGSVESVYGITGAEKLAAATAEVYSLVPVFLRVAINRKFISKIVQRAFDKIENYAKLQVEKKSNK